MSTQMQNNLLQMAANTPNPSSSPNCAHASVVYKVQLVIYFRITAATTIFSAPPTTVSQATRKGTAPAMADLD